MTLLACDSLARTNLPKIDPPSSQPPLLPFPLLLELFKTAKKIESDHARLEKLLETVAQVIISGNLRSNLESLDRLGVVNSSRSHWDTVRVCNLLPNAVIFTAPYHWATRPLDCEADSGKLSVVSCVDCW